MTSAAFTVESRLFSNVLPIMTPGEIAAEACLPTQSAPAPSLVPWIPVCSDLAGWRGVGLRRDAATLLRGELGRDTATSGGAPAPGVRRPGALQFDVVMGLFIVLPYEGSVDVC